MASQPHSSSEADDGLHTETLLAILVVLAVLFVVAATGIALTML